MMPENSPCNSIFPRLAMLSLLLPIALLILAFAATDDLRQDFSGLTAFWQTMFVLGAAVFPVAGMVLVLLKGWWKMGTVLLMTPMLLLMVAGAIDPAQYRERGTLEFHVYTSRNFFEGTEVYCNGIMLGTVPMEMSVEELLQKVPRWTPPEQPRQAEAGTTEIATWIPWDGFISERLEQRRQLDRSQDARQLDKSCEFWWSFRHQGATAIGFRNDNDFRRRRIEKSSYPVQNYLSIVYPAKFALFEVLFAALEEADGKPGEDWLEYIADHGDLLDELLHRAGVKPAVVDAVVRRRYGLGDIPTAEQCDRAIAKILHDNHFDRSFQPLRYRLWRGGIAQDFFGESVHCRNVMVENAVRQLGPECREPLLRRFQNVQFGMDLKSELDREVLVYILGQYPFADFFEEFVRYYARTRHGFVELMRFDDQRLIPLLETLLRDRDKPFDEKDLDIQQKCAALVPIDNPTLEPMLRRYIAGNLHAFRNHGQQLYYILCDYVDDRIRRADYEDDSPNREELARWIGGFSISAERKNTLVMKTKGYGSVSVALPQGPENFTEDGQYIPTGEYGKLGLWSQKHPAEPIESYLNEKLKDADPYSNKKYLTEMFTGQLLHQIIPGLEDFETLSRHRLEFLRYVWNDLSLRESVLKNLVETWSEWMVETRSNQFYITGDDGFPVYVPGLTLPIRAERREEDLSIKEYRYPEEIRRMNLPGEMVPLLAELSEPEQCRMVVDLLQRVETPEAEALLETWSRSADAKLAERAETARNRLRDRLEFKRTLRENGKKILSGEIEPDGLCLANDP